MGPKKQHTKVGGKKAGAKAEAHAVRDDKGHSGSSKVPGGKARMKRLEGKAL